MPRQTYVRENVKGSISRTSGVFLITNAVIAECSILGRFGLNFASVTVERELSEDVSFCTEKSLQKCRTGEK